MVEKKMAKATQSSTTLTTTAQTPTNPLMIVYEDYLNTKCAWMSPYQKKLFIAQASMNNLDPTKWEIYWVPFRNSELWKNDYLNLVLQKS